MMGGKKLRGNRVWSANKEGLVGREYKFSLIFNAVINFFL